MVKVKICGIHSLKEANSAFKKGADYLGLLINIPKTNLSLIPNEAKKIVSKQKKVKFIILTIEKNPKKIYALIKIIKPWGVQLLRPTKQIIRYLSKKSLVKIIPVLHITGKSSIKKAKHFYDADYILLDSRTKKHLGGTGKVHNWTISKKIIEDSPIPIFLAGGLNESNVKKAIKKLYPYCVDAESSLRNYQGYRDEKKIDLFIKKAKY